MSKSVFNLLACYDFTYLFKLFGDIRWVFPEFSSEAFRQDQRVEQSCKTSLGCMAEELWQAWQVENEIIFTQKRYQAMLVFFCPPRSTQHTFADAHSISEDPCCVLGQPKLLNGDGAQLSLNETKTKQRIHYCEHNDRKINQTKCARTNLPIYFHLCSFDLSLERKPKKTQNNSFEKKYLQLYYKTVYDVISDLMVSLFLSLFKVFKGLFSFTLNWMSLNSLLFDSNSI